MKNEILLNLDNPAQLERLYRTDKTSFRQAFKALYPELEDSMPVRFWQERLNFTSEEVSWGTSKDLVFVLIAGLLAGIIAKPPALLAIDEEFFYPRNFSFTVLPMLMAYFAWKNKLSTAKIASIAGLTLFGVIFINSFHGTLETDTLVLSCIHLPLFLWSVLGFAFIGETGTNHEKRLGFLRYNGDLVVITVLILLAGAVLTGVTIGLFSLIGFNIEKFYFENIVVFMLPTAPILGSYLIQANPQLVGKVSPVIARIFSPLIVVMLVTYLAAIAYSGKNPYNDREFLLIFNALLIGVMAIIFFSVAETSKKTKTQTEIWILGLLSLITIIVNGIALSAILFRISEWGITPNRAAILGGNVLILGNLILVTTQLFRTLSRKAELSSVGRAISGYLPVYFLWTIIVTFIFPMIFGGK